MFTEKDKQMLIFCNTLNSKPLQNIDKFVGFKKKNVIIIIAFTKVFNDPKITNILVN